MEEFFLLIVIALLCFICAMVSRRTASEPNAEIGAAKMVAAVAASQASAYDEAQKRVTEVYHRQLAEDKARVNEFYRKQVIYCDNWERYISALREQYPEEFFYKSAPGIKMPFERFRAVLIKDTPIPFTPTEIPRVPKVWESAVTYGYYERYPLVDPREFDGEVV